MQAPLDDVSVYGCFFHTKNEKENENGKFQRRRASEYAEPLMCPCDGTGNKHLYPQAKFWVGPVVAEGFYYDIDLGDDVIRDEDIEAITKEMKKVIKSGKKIIRREVSKEEALEMFKDDPYKLDLIEDLEDGNITVYDQGDFTDLCRGPHVDNVKLCKYFKLIRHSGAYWKGDS